MREGYSSSTSKRGQPQAAVSDEQPAAALPSRRQFLRVFIPAALPMFLSGMDQTIVAAALPAIAATLGDASSVSWVFVAYLVASTIAAPVYGRLGDTIGRKPMILVALVVLVGASVLCAFAPSTAWLIAGRIVQGLGGGGLMAMSQALIGETVPPRERAGYQGYFAGVAVVASAFGPVAGGLLTDSFGWRSIFWVNVPLGLIAIFLVARLPSRRLVEGPLRFDFWGLLIFSCLVTSTLLLFELVRQRSPDVLSLLALLAAISFASLALLIWREARAPVPLLPLALLGRPVIWRTNALAACHGALLIGLLALMPLYFRARHGASPSEIGFLLLPMTMLGGIGATFTGLMVRRTGRTTIFPTVSLAVMVVLTAVIGFAAPELSRGWLAATFGVVALLMGCIMVVIQLIVQIEAGVAMLGMATSSVQYCRLLGAAVGAAAITTAFFSTIAAGGGDPSRLLEDILQHGSAALAAAGVAEQAAMHAAIDAAYRNAMLVIAGISALGLGLAISIPVRRIALLGRQ